MSGNDIPFPTAINIELTTFCNLRCIMCPKTSGIARTASNKKMSAEVLDKIISEVLPHIFRVDLVGDGEILLEPNMLKTILKAANARHALVNASTNAVLLTELMAEMLVENKLHDLNISLDAASAETFKEIRGADLDKVLNNIKTLNEVKNAANSAYPRLQFSLVGMKRNIRELPELVSLARKFNVESVMVQAMGEFQTVKDESVYLRDKTTGKYWLEKAKEQAAHSNIRINLWPEDQFEDVSNDSSSNDSTRIKDCSFPWDIPYFATDGSVSPCCAMPALGSLLESSFKEIWFGNKYSRLRRQIKSENPPEECVSCPGRGWYTPATCKDQLQPGKHDHQFGTGWFETESYKNEFYRWARENAVFFISGSGPAILEIEIHTVWDPGTTQEIEIQVDDEPVRNATFDFGERRKVYIPVADKGLLHSIRLKGKGWRPVTTVKGELDPRSLSVMFYGAQLIQMQEIITFSNAVRLVGWTCLKLDKSNLTLRLYWDLPPDWNEQCGLFLHAFPQTGESLKNIKILSLELQERFLGTGYRTQIDCSLPDKRESTELYMQDIILPLTANSSDQIAVYIGLIDKTGQRIKPDANRRNIYRSSVYLDSFKVLDNQ